MKEAKTTYNIHSNLKKRWSPRAYANKPVENEKLQRLFEAARWTPSAFNSQPWNFIIGQNGDHSYKKIFDCLIEFNQLWAKFAPVLVLSIGKKTSSTNNTLLLSYQYDVGQSVSHLTFQAMEEGLYIHQMTGFDANKAIKNFNIPDDYEALSVFTIGYLGDPSILNKHMQKTETAERQRKSVNEFVFEMIFGQTSELFKS